MLDSSFRAAIPTLTLTLTLTLIPHPKSNPDPNLLHLYLITFHLVLAGWRHHTGLANVPGRRCGFLIADALCVMQWGTRGDSVRD